jgi:hypothetical protein
LKTEELESRFLEALSIRLGSVSSTHAKQCWSKKDLSLAQFSCLTHHARWCLIPSKFTYEEDEYITFIENSSMVTSDLCPIYLLRLLAKDVYPSRRKRAAENEKCPPDILMDLAIGGDEFLQLAVAENPNCPEPVLAELFDRNKLTFATLETITRNPNCPDSILKDIAITLDESPPTLTPTQFQSLLTIIANSSKCPANLIETCTNHPDIQVQAYVAANSALTIGRKLEILKNLAKCSDNTILGLVARNPVCPEIILNKLTKNSDFHVRLSVASNINCPLALLRVLVRDKNYMVFTTAAEHPNCSVELLEELAHTTGQKKSILKHVTRNKMCPLSALEILSKNKDGEVRSEVAMHANCSIDLLRDLSKTKIKNVIYSVASNQKCPIDVLEHLSKHANKVVRVAAMNHPNCSDALLFEVFNKPEMTKILNNTLLLKPEALSKLAQHDSEEVSTAALINMNHPEWQRTLQSDLMKNPWFQAQFSNAILEEKEAVVENNILYFGGKDANKSLSSTSSIRRLLALASKAELAPAKIVKLSKGGDWLQRMAVARNPNTPHEILVALAEDINDLVSRQAIATQVRGPLLETL